MNYIEKRIFRRLDAQVPVELESRNNKIQTIASNISCGGMFLEIDPSQLGEDHEVNVFVHLPNRDKPVKLIAEVTRSEAGDRQGIALQFQGLYNDNILAIERFVKSHLH